MLTKRQIENIQNFDKLNSNHRRVFRYFLKKKCEKTLKHLIFVLSSHQNLNMKPEDIVNLKDLTELVKTAERVNKRKFYDMVKSLSENSKFQPF